MLSRLALWYLFLLWAWLEWFTLSCFPVICLQSVVLTSGFFLSPFSSTMLCALTPLSPSSLWGRIDLSPRDYPVAWLPRAI